MSFVSTTGGNLNNKKDPIKLQENYLYSDESYVEDSNVIGTSLEDKKFTIECKYQMFSSRIA